jgi:hypothetical protein
MTYSTKTTDSPVSIRDCNALLVSTVCHLVAMIVLGLSIGAGRDRAQPLNLLVSTAESPISLDPGESLAQDAVEISVGSAEPDRAAGELRLFDAPALATSEMALLASPLELSALESGQDGKSMSLLHEGAGGGHFAVGASKFFGVSGYGNSFVYVVDCSGSMKESGKLERAKYELLQSIDQLSDDQKYFVIFYNTDAIPMDGKAPIEATEDNFARTRRWVELVDANGGTNPLPALLIALSLRPDAIYFLSDGLFDGHTITQVRTINRRKGKIPIHSIAFVSRENLGLMRSVARDSGGEFRFVN